MSNEPESDPSPAPDLATGSVVAVFTADWCPLSGDILDGWSAVTTKSRVVNVNVDQFPGLAEQWKIVCVPTVLRISSGSEKARFIGGATVRNRSQKS